MLDGEIEVFEACRARLRAEFSPQTSFAVSLVERLASLEWQELRYRALEAANLTLEIERMRAAVDSEFADISFDIRTALAHRQLCDQSSVLQTLNRQLSRISREFHRTASLLRDLPTGPANQPSGKDGVPVQTPASDRAPHSEMQNEGNALSPNGVSTAPIYVEPRACVIKATSPPAPASKTAPKTCEKSAGHATLSDLRACSATPLDGAPLSINGTKPERAGWDSAESSPSHGHFPEPRSRAQGESL